MKNKILVFGFMFLLMLGFGLAFTLNVFADGTGTGSIGFFGNSLYTFSNANLTKFLDIPETVGAVTQVTINLTGSINGSKADRVGPGSIFPNQNDAIMAFGVNVWIYENTHLDRFNKFDIGFQAVDCSSVIADLGITRNASTIFTITKAFTGDAQLKTENAGGCGDFSVINISVQSEDVTDLTNNGSTLFLLDEANDEIDMYNAGITYLSSIDISAVIEFPAGIAYDNLTNTLWVGNKNATNNASFHQFLMDGTSTGLNFTANSIPIGGRMTLALIDNVLFASTTADTGVTRFVLTNPFNVTLDVGNNSNIDYMIVGELNSTNTTTNLASSISRYLTGCSIVDGNCTVPIVFNSVKGGNVDYSGITLTNIGFLEEAQTFDSITQEGSAETFTLNLTYDFLLYNSISADLVYNNTRFTGTSTGGGNNLFFTRTITAPGLDSQANKTFYWEVELNNGTATAFFNSTNNTQTVNPLSIDNCGVNTQLLLNYTVRDEGDQSFLLGGTDNVTVNVDLSISTLGTTNKFFQFNHTYAFTNPATICISEDVLNTSDYRLDVLTSYESLDHVLEFHNIQNYTLNNNTQTQQINLYDLKTLDAQEFKLIFKDQTFLPVENALIDITRNYIGDGVFRSVEVPKTDVDGSTIGNLVLSDVIYTFIVKKEGQLLATFENVRATCQDLSTGACTINLIAGSTSGDVPNWETLNGLSYSLNYSDSTRVFSASFTTVSGETALVSLNVTTFNGDSFVCSNQLSSSSGTISCTVPTSFANETIIGTLFKNGDFVAQMFVTLRDESPFDSFGYTGVVLLLILYLTLPLMFITDKIGVIVAAIFGFVFAGLLGIYSSGNVIGLGSVVLWFMVAGGVLIWKLNQGGKSGI